MLYYNSNILTVAQLVERLTVEDKHGNQTVVGSIPTGEIIGF